MSRERLKEMLNFLLVVAMLATVVVLVLGLVSFFKGGEFNDKYGNLLMRARVGFQFLALLVVLALIASS
ncbi:MAG: twin transmembrane helix small protein [Geminicoccaceae bacterium]|nr:twin transmembrane helix small protein [Geminicoccaceae bacterium]